MQIAEYFAHAVSYWPIMGKKPGDAKVFFFGGLQILGYALGLITAIQFGFRIFASEDWASGASEIYRSTIYQFHDYTYVPIVSRVGVTVTDRFKDLFTVYLMGCAAQLHYLNILSGKVRPILGAMEKTPVIIYMELKHKLAYIFLWPIVIIADFPFILKNRPILSSLVNDRRRRTPTTVLDDFKSSPYFFTMFLQGFVLALLIVLVTLLTNAG